VRGAPLAGFAGTPPASQGENQGSARKVQRRCAARQSQRAEIGLPYPRLSRLQPGAPPLRANHQGWAGATARRPAPAHAARVLWSRPAGALLCANSAAVARTQTAPNQPSPW